MYYPNSSYVFKAMFANNTNGVCRYTVFIDDGILDTGEISQYTEKSIASINYRTYTLDYLIPEFCANKDTVLLFELYDINSGIVISSANQQIYVQPLEDYIHAQDIVDFEGVITASITADLTKDTTLTIYKGNTLVKSTIATIQGTDKYVSIDTTALSLAPSMQPYLCSWRTGTEIEPFNLYIVNPSIYSVLDDLKKNLDRLHQQARLPELEYGYSDYMRWLKLGMDMFNAGGLMTTFDMTNATGLIRYWWLNCSMIQALTNQYLVEGRKSFNFNGQSVTLDVDITQYLQTRYGELQGEWDNAANALKDQLKNYGLNGGDGDINNANLVVGTVGISLGPASHLGTGGMNTMVLKQLSSTANWWRNASY